MKYLIGIQPTGRLHIGNYLGCIQKGLNLESEGHEVIWLVANYHAMTTGQYFDITHELKRFGCRNIVLQDHKNLELMWELLCKCPVSELQRMTQWKDKGAGNAGLLTYPVLMAADILIHNPDYVIVGDDQIQHMELARFLAKKTGRPEPKFLLSDSPRIMSLRDPSKKMSKSLGDNHVVYLFDEDYLGKLSKAVTDEAGKANLIKIANGFGVELSESMEQLKASIARTLEKMFSP